MNPLRCAITHFFVKPHSEYDKTEFPTNYLEPNLRNVDMKSFLNLNGKLILYLGVLFYLLEITFDREIVILGALSINLMLSLPYLFNIFDRYGVDMTAYIN